MKKKKRLTFCSRPYTCSECHRSFTQQSSLATHKRIHSGEKPFSCTVCGREFANAGNMKIHMRVHTGERPFECVFCQRGFSQQNSLKAHLRIHSGEKPFNCAQCEKTFRVLGNLKKHQYIHNEEGHFECCSCTEKFKLKTELRKHKKSIHGIETPIVRRTRARKEMNKVVESVNSAENLFVNSSSNINTNMIINSINAVPNNNMINVSVDSTVGPAISSTFPNQHFLGISMVQNSVGANNKNDSNLIKVEPGNDYENFSRNNDNLISGMTTIDMETVNRIANYQ